MLRARPLRDPAMHVSKPSAFAPAKGASRLVVDKRHANQLNLWIEYGDHSLLPIWMHP